MAKLALLGGSPVRAKPYLSWPLFDETEVNAVTEAVRSGKWWRYEGDRVEAFEKAFAATHGAGYGIACASGTAALEIILGAMGLGPGDEVIVPSYTFIASASAIVINQATPVFADVQPDTYNISPECFEEAVTERTKAVVAVHFAGFPSDMDEIMRIAIKRGVLVVEDAAHAHGGEYRGKMMGSIGDAAAFSFQASKNMTCGEGGISLCGSAELAEKIFSRHTFGRMPGRPWYEHYIMGTNLRMTEMQAAILLAQLARLKRQTEERLKNADVLDAAFGNRPEEFGLMRPRDEGTKKRAYHLYMLRYLNGGRLKGISRELFSEAMRAEGVGVNPGYGMPLYRQEVFKTVARPAGQAVPYDKLHHPAAEKAVVEALWIPQQALVGDSSQVDDIAAAAEKIIDNADELRGYGKNE